MSKGYPKNYRLPAEFETQEAIWLSWPSNKESCPKTFHKLQDKFGEIASTISRYERVRINAPMLSHMNIRLSIADNEGDLSQVDIYENNTNDVWCRDHGPIFIKHNETGKVAIIEPSSGPARSVARDVASRAAKHEVDAGRGVGRIDLDVRPVLELAVVVRVRGVEEPGVALGRHEGQRVAVEGIHQAEDHGGVELVLRVFDDREQALVDDAGGVGLVLHARRLPRDEAGLGDAVVAREGLETEALAEDVVDLGRHGRQCHAA